MKLAQTVVTNIVISVAFAAGLAIGATLFNERVEPRKNGELHKENEN